MPATRIRVSTRRTGARRVADVYVYDTAAELQAAARRFSPGAPDGFANTLGVCHYVGRYTIGADGSEQDMPGRLIVRLVRGHLGTEVVTHEMTHAAVAIYGESLPRDTLAVDVLVADNEVIAHLVSDLTRRLVDQLYARGLYE